MQFQTFDAGYIEALCAGDLRVQEHFVDYFTELIHLKVRSRLPSRQAQEDARQETFARVLTTLRKENGLRQPERLGAFVNTVCNNVLFEQYRSSSRQQSLDADDQPELPCGGAAVDDVVARKTAQNESQRDPQRLSPRDRSVCRRSLSRRGTGRRFAARWASTGNTCGSCSSAQNKASKASTSERMDAEQRLETLSRRNHYPAQERHRRPADGT